MDYFQQDCAHIANQFSAEPATSTNEDKTTHRRWGQGVLAFYACLLLAGATAIGVTQLRALSSDAVQQASMQVKAK